MRTAPVSPIRDPEEHQQHAGYDQHVLVGGRRRRRGHAPAVYGLRRGCQGNGLSECASIGAVASKQFRYTATAPSPRRFRIALRIVTRDHLGYTQEFSGRREGERRTHEPRRLAGPRCGPISDQFGDSGRLAEERARGTRPDTLLLLEHPPTITLGRRGVRKTCCGTGNVSLARASRSSASAGAAARRTTAPASCRLCDHPLLEPGRGVRRFVSKLEALLVDVSESFHVKASLRAGHPGLWVGECKLASIGIEVRQGISRHGFALNVDVDPRPFRGDRSVRNARCRDHRPDAPGGITDFSRDGRTAGTSCMAAALWRDRRGGGEWARRCGLRPAIRCDG